MKLPQQRNNRLARAVARSAGFTLAEVLAALLFMAIVIPVAIEALRVANLAGVVAERKGQAARIAETVLNENLLMSNAVLTAQSGTVREGTREFHYTLKAEPWSQHLTNQIPQRSSQSSGLVVSQPQVDQMAVSQIAMNHVTVEVLYTVQGREYSVMLDTLVETQ